MRRFLAGMVGIWLLAGCNSQPYVTRQRLERGLVIVLPGVEGRGALNEAICRGLDRGGVDWAIRLWDWTAPLGPLYNLRSETRNRGKAGELASEITMYQFDYPQRPVVIVGHSGGAAIGTWAAETMPKGRQIDGLIMLAPALSPGYMLDWALANCRRGAVNFYSYRDWFFLGVGTTLSGTMDGYHTSSAGRWKFQAPAAGGRPEAYGKLFQLGWGDEMSDAGYRGGHLDTSRERFVATYVAPLVLNTKWDADLMAAVLNRETRQAWREGIGATTGPPKY